MSHCLRWFIDYWDRVVDVWLDKHSIIQSKVVYANRPLELEKEKEDYYKDDHLTVNIEIEQLPWYKDETTAKFLCPIHMPEPYWGNPEKCSIVIINYNPGGGLDMSPHTYKGKGAPYPDNTMIEYVNRKSYSALASDFPLLKTKEELEKDERWWLRSYGGRKWWLRKKEWMLHLVQAWEEEGEKQSNGKEVKWPISIRRPFAIELCGWHSPNWPNGVITGYLKGTIERLFAEPLLAAIDSSKTHLAVCIGSDFKPSILGEYISIENVTTNLISSIEEKITKEFEFHGSSKVMYLVNWMSEANDDGSLKVKATISHRKKCLERERFYRIYTVKGFDKNLTILNTFAPGGNHHPAEHFWPFEKELINVIKELI